MRSRSQTLTGPSIRPSSRRGGFVAALLRLDARFRQRRVLERLDDARLRDLGLDRDEIARETGRPAWNAPDWWR